MKWGAAAGIIILLFALSLWTLFYGKPAGRTAPKVEETFVAPTIGLAGITSENTSTDLNSKPADSEDSLSSSGLGLPAPYPRLIPAAALAELGQIVRPRSGPRSGHLSANAIDQQTAIQRLSQLDKVDRVCMVEVNGKSVVCPLDLLEISSSAIVQSETQGIPWMLTWCRETQTLVAYERTVNGVPLDFRNDPLECHGNLVLTDSDSESQWVQLLGVAIKGQFAGERLRRLPLLVLPWERARELLPQAFELAWIAGWDESIGKLSELHDFELADDRGFGFVSVNHQAFYQYIEKESHPTDQIDLSVDSQITSVFDYGWGQFIFFLQPAQPVTLDSQANMVRQTDQGESDKKWLLAKLKNGGQLFFPENSWTGDLTTDTTPPQKLPQVFPILTRESTWKAFHSEGAEK